MIHLNVWEWAAVCLLPGTGWLMHVAQCYGYHGDDWLDSLKQANNVAIALSIIAVAYVLIHVGPLR